MSDLKWVIEAIVAVAAAAVIIAVVVVGLNGTDSRDPWP